MIPLRYRRATIAVVAIVVAAALQTTLFVRLRVFDAAPALVLLVVISLARHLRPEFALFAGFGAGLLEDLLSSSALGLWALTLTTVAYLVLRVRERMEGDYSLIAPFVFAFTAGGIALFAVLGTIFGEQTLADAGVLRKIVMPALLNVALAALILPALRRALAVDESVNPYLR
jgi:rod shape-determining protein MreD